ncbi:MAG: hypothetical protein OEO71_12230 [Gammaproteobacteria bacterium]|nr:hypothetical protein [Gammaproteobacteria bacterium]
MQLIKELRRRRVFRTAALYIVAAWIILQVASLAFPALDIPDSAIRFVWIGAFLGFPIAVVFGWRYQITTEGIEKTRPLAAGEVTADLSLGRTDFILLAALSVVLVVIAGGVIREIQSVKGPGLSVFGREIPPNSIAVLPLENLTGNPEEEYLAIALQEALISDLAVISGLRVTSRTSSGRYVNSNKSIAEIGVELGVAYLVEGTMQRIGDQIRLRLQLIDAELDELLWSDNYDRNLEDILVLQGEVARTVSDELGVELAQDERRRLTRTRKVNPEVYKLVVKGTYFAKQLDPVSIDRGLELLNQAISVDPREPLAYAGLALGYNIIGHGANAHGAFPKAKAAAQKALSLDEYSGAGWAALGEAEMYYDWDWDKARASQLKALQLSPSLDQMYAHYAYLLLLYGDVDEAISMAEKARDLSPLDPLWAGFAAWIYMLEARWEDAHQAIEECLSYSPGFSFCLYTEAQSLTAQGKVAEALEVLENGDQNDPFVLWALAPTYALAERREDALNIAQGWEAQPTTRNLMHLSFTHSALGDMDKALGYLEQSLEARTDWLPWIVFDNAYGGVVEPMRGHPRYQAVVDQMKLPLSRNSKLLD